MAIPTTAIDFVECLRKSRLLTDDVLASYEADLPSLPQDIAKLAGLFVRREVLTPLQARMVLSGMYRGFHIGPYVITAEIGRGGMGAVYLGKHKDLRRHAAMKVLLAGKSAQPGAVERFLREAQAAAALDHPNIVGIFDIIHKAPSYWLIMEHVDGCTLDAAVQRSGTLPVGRVCDYAVQTTAGLKHASEKGFVHRDIKPANLMVSKTGVVKILDMGLARAGASDIGTTDRLDRGAILGTADYISPEQAVRSQSVDVRADLYSLGATMFTLLTGRPPFAGNTAQKLIQHQRTPAPRITDVDPTLPPGLADVVAKLLAKNPNDRFQRPADLAAALSPWLPSQSGSLGGLSGILIGARATGDTIRFGLDKGTKSMESHVPK